MIQLIVGNEGKGKTREMLDKVNAEIKEASGNIVFLDKNTKHMYELNNRIRLVDVSEYDFTSTDEFYGFICGIISQDHDLEQLYFDNFKRIACVSNEDLEKVLDKFKKLSEARNVRFCISIAVSEAEIPAAFKDDIVVSL
ncbi:MAG: twitching motility protein PilT [Lachnospiraceae bacterium]|nr:twitching motility protein PilT [Lachnospiraceae bacterium]